MNTILCANLASAAVLIGGRTIHGTCGLGQMVPKDHKKLSDSMISKLTQLHGLSLVWGCILDEISAVDSNLFYHLDYRFRDLLGEKNLPFGGMSFLVFGDFFQLPPPSKGLSLYRVAVIHALSQSGAVTNQNKRKQLNPDQVAAAITFLKFNKVELLVNMRTIDDPVHSSLIRNLRSAIPGSYPLKEFLLPIINDFVLTSADVRRDVEFRLAPVLVSTNEQRFTIIRARACAVALSLGVPLVRWRIPLGATILSSLKKSVIDEIYNDNAFMWGYFIQGCKGYMSKNLNTFYSVCNGSPILYYALQLGNDTDDVEYDGYTDRDSILISTAKPGEDVIIEPPFAVYVTLDGVPVDKLNANGVDLLDNIAFPVLAVHPVKYKVFFKGLGKRLELSLKVHGVDPFFSATFYKAQGQTMSRVIADLSADIMPMHYEAVFVFLSRVKFGRHAKILPLHPLATWNHLSSLRPNDDLCIYLGGFKHTTVFNTKDGQETVERIIATTCSTAGKSSRKDKGVSTVRSTPSMSSLSDPARLGSSSSSSLQQRTVLGKRSRVRPECTDQIVYVFCVVSYISILFIIIEFISYLRFL